MGNVYVIELLLNSWIDFDGIMCLSGLGLLSWT